MSSKVSYSQLKAMLAISKASLRSMKRNPSVIVFNLIFPLIFIIVFGFISGSKFKMEAALDKSSDNNNPVLENLRNVNTLKITEETPGRNINTELEKGTLDAIIKIQKEGPPDKKHFVVYVKTSTASPEKSEMVKLILNQIAGIQLKKMFPDAPVMEIKEEQVTGRKYETIDFILPGQLGFSILSAGVFGTAFVFVSLRQTLVLKRFFATPVKKPFIILGEAISRLTYTLAGSLIIILIGYYVFGFTLVNGFVTVINLLVLCSIGLLVFMGFGFLVSGIARNENAVPPVANLITLPQFLLSGTFFTIEAFPEWLQPVAKILPLTYLNEALRKVAFEGAGLHQVSFQIMILLAWGIAVYAISIKVFKWE
jgi:ABC-2 type transport system permease protein